MKSTDERPESKFLPPLQHQPERKRQERHPMNDAT